MNERPPIISLRNVTKRFGKVTALDNVSLDIRPGSIIGLLGDNGAGKSTLLRHIVGLYLPDDGECTTFDCPVADLRAEHLARIGYVHQNGELLDWMTVRQFIRYVSSYYETWNATLVEQFIRDFDVSVKSRIGALSPGQAQRLAVPAHLPLPLHILRPGHGAPCPYCCPCSSFSLLVAHDSSFAVLSAFCLLASAFTSGAPLAGARHVCL